MLHRLRGLYDTYDVMHLPPDYPDPPPAVLELRAFMERARRAARCAARVLRARGGAARRAGRPRGPVRVPRPVHPRARALPRRHRPRAGGDRAATARSRPRCAEREGYFPPGADVFVAHPPTGLEGLARAGAGATCSPSAGSTRRSAIDLLIARDAARPRETSSCGSPARARTRRGCASWPRGDPAHRVLRARRRATSSPRSTRARARSRSSRTQEDFGLVTLEAMLAGKPVITCTDSGGTAELVTDGVRRARRRAAAPEALAAAIDELWSSRREARRMGARRRCERARRGDVGRRRASELTAAA